jgi:hypothetical protein
MTADELFRCEWAMSIEVPKIELLPCFCYELTREWIREAQRRRPDLIWDQPVWDGFWINDFEQPYLLLNPKEKNKITKAYPSYFTKELADFGKYNRPKSEILRDVEFWLTLRGKSKKGRAAILARIRNWLRYLGAYRILQKYRWNRLPIQPADIELYRSQREWINAKKQAQELIRLWFLILLSLLRTPAK